MQTYYFLEMTKRTSRMASCKADEWGANLTSICASLGSISAQEPTEKAVCQYHYTNFLAGCPE
jgi:hypothetical protein